MNPLLDLQARIQANGAGARPADDRNSGSGTETAPAGRPDAASSEAALPEAGKGARKNGLMGRLAGKLRGMDFGQPAARSDSQLAETQVGNEATPVMNFRYTPGSQPLPRYTIRRGIGVGGFGEVYFAVSEAGKEVAMKRIQRNLEIELRGASQCLNLKHPNLVALYDICRDDEDQSWVVMEYVAGKNLRQILDMSPDGLPLDQVHRWFAAIASGVAHLHSAGLVHRDIKPGNVFDDLGTVKVGDYGLSKFISASHRGGHTESVGTFHYMAPEIGRGQYGREIDIYALGILLYELLTGRVPFDGESSHEIIVKHLTAMPDLSGIKQPYRAVIGKCLEKDPEKRYHSIEQMMDALGLPLTDGTAGVATAQLVGETPPTAAPAGAATQPHQPEWFGRSAAPQEASAAASQRTSPQSPDPLDSLAHEPLARAVRASVSDFGRWWRSLDHSPGVKALLVLALGFFLLLNSHWLVITLTLIGLFYVPYYIVRQMLLHGRHQPSYAQAQRMAAVQAPPPPSAPVRPPRPISRKQWCQQMRSGLRAKGSLQRAAELHTSWIAAVMTVTGLALAAGVMGLRQDPVSAAAVAHYSWLGIVALMSTFAVLGLGKLWEREEGESLPRRFVLAGLGAGVGAAAFALHQYLLLPIDKVYRDVDVTGLPAALYDGRVPTVGALMAHFAVLFAAVRWWKPVDPLRRRRLSLWSVAIAVAAEWAVHQVLPIPQPAGMMIAGGTAIAVQMSAPWINRRAETASAQRSHTPGPVNPNDAPGAQAEGVPGLGKKRPRSRSMA